jgi:carboxylesterase
LARWERRIERDEDGVRLGCADFTLGSGEVALLLVHGFGDSPAVFRPLAELLAERGFTCRAMRLPGFAMRTEEYAQTSREKCLAAIETELQALREKHTRVVVIGHSLGAALLIEHLIDHPAEDEDIAAAAVLLAPQIGVCNDRSPVFSARTWYRIGRRLLIFSQMLENIFPVDGHSDRARSFDLQAVFVPAGLYDIVFETIDQIAHRAADFTIPQLMVLASDDKVIDTVAAERFFEVSESPRKDLHHQQDAGHNLPMDNGWRELAEQIARFVQRADDALTSNS